MAKVEILLEDTDDGLKIEPKFTPELGALDENHKLTTAQSAAFDILQALAAAADEVVLEDEIYAKSAKKKDGMH